MLSTTRRHASALGSWRMSFAAPPANLAGAIATLWDVEGVTRYAHERILPTGHIDILFSLADEQYLLDADRPAIRTCFATVWVSGLQQRPLLAQSAGTSHLLGLRLTPTGAWRFFGRPLHELTGRVLDLDLVLGSSLLELREQLALLPDPERRLRRLLEFAERRIARGPAVHPCVAHAVRRIESEAGNGPVSGITAETGFSRKHLIRKFAEQVGLAPKRYARLCRFRRAVRSLQSGREPDLAVLALDCGYFDQAHFSNDFRAFAGASPSEFARQRLPEEVTAVMARA
jgi:AraC-like DNA-binding protein